MAGGRDVRLTAVIGAKYGDFIRGMDAVDNRVKRTGSQFENLAKQTTKFTAIAGGASAAIAGTAGLSGALLAATGAATQLAGAAPLLVTGFTAVKAVALTTKIALHGVGEEITKQLEPAMDGLARNAQKFANQFGQFVEPIKKLRLGIQNEFFRPLTDSLGGLAKFYFPMVNKAGVEMAHILGGNVKQALVSLNTEASHKNLRQMFDSILVSVRSLAPAIAKIPATLLAVGAAAGKAFALTSSSASSGLNGLIDRINKAAQSGQLEKWIKTAIDRFKQFASVVSSVASMVTSLVRAASGVFGGLGTDLQSAAKQLAAFMKSAQGQQQLREFFEATVPILKLFGMTAKVVMGIVKELAPTINRLGQQFLTYLQPVLPVIEGLLKEIGEVMIQILPYISRLAVAVGGTLMLAFKAIEPILPIILETFTDLIGPTGLLGEGIKALTPVFQSLVEAGAAVVKILAEGLTEALKVIGPYLPPLADAFGKLAIVVAQALVQALEAVVPYLPQMIEDFTALVIASTPLIEQIMKLAINIGTNLLPYVATAITVLTQVAKVVIPAVVVALQGLNLIVKGVGVIFNTIFKGIVNLFLWVVEQIITGAVKAFGWVPGVGGKLKEAQKSFKEFQKSVNNSLSGITDQQVVITAKVLQGKATAAGVAHGGVRAYARGGRLPGYGGGDRVPAMLEAGEAIVPKHLVPEMAGWASSKGIPGFAAGGVAGGVTIKPSLPSGPSLKGFAQDVFETSLAVNKDVLHRIAKMFSGALGFARSQAGKPYVWGGVGPNGYDCSGFISALVNVAQGRNPYQRRFTTESLPAGLFDGGLGGRFQVGWFKGNPGHVAGTIDGVNVESRGGDGVVVGGSARGARSSLFNMHGSLRGFAKGGYVGDAPFDLLNPKGAYYQPGLGGWLKDANVYDQGGRLPTGASVVNNGTGRPELVLTPEMETALSSPDAIGKAVARELSRSTLASEIGQAVAMVIVKGQRR